MRGLGLQKIGVLLGLALALTGCNVQVGIPLSGATAKSVASNDPMTQRFADTVATGVKLDSGVSLQVIGAGTDISVMVLNLSDEPVIFPDQSFGLRAYLFDVKTNDWHEQQLLLHAAPQPKTIPAKVGKYDAAVNNIWDLGPRPLGSVNISQFRLYVEGTGTITSQKYGAYADVNLN